MIVTVYWVISRSLTEAHQYLHIFIISFIGVIHHTLPHIPLPPKPLPPTPPPPPPPSPFPYPPPPYTPLPYTTHSHTPLPHIPPSSQSFKWCLQLLNSTIILSHFSLFCLTDFFR